MTTDDKIKDEKSQHDINREAAKISALSSRKSDKYEYLTVKEILPSNQIQIIEQAEFAFLENQKGKQVGLLKSLKLSNGKYELKQIDGVFSQNMMNDFIRDKLKKIVTLLDIIKMDELHYKSKRRKV